MNSTVDEQNQRFFLTYENGKPFADSRRIARFLNFDHTKILIALRTQAEFADVHFHGGKKSTSEFISRNFGHGELYGMLNIPQAYILVTYIVMELGPGKNSSYLLDLFKIEILNATDVVRTSTNDMVRAESATEEEGIQAQIYAQLTRAEGEFTLQEAAAILARPKLGRNNLARLLREKKVFLKNNIPSRYQIERGRFRIQEIPYETTLYGRPVTRVYKGILITQKGLEFVTGLLSEEPSVVDELLCPSEAVFVASR